MIISALCHHGQPIIHPSDEAKLRDFYLAMEGKTVWLSIEDRKPPRSLGQNAFYWRLLTTIGNETGDTPEELHEHFKEELLPRFYMKLSDREVPIEKSTTRLTSAEFTKYLEKVIALAATHYNVIIPDYE